MGVRRDGVGALRTVTATICALDATRGTNKARARARTHNVRVCVRACWCACVTETETERERTKPNRRKAHTRSSY